MKSPIRICLAGAAGKMGQEVARSISSWKGIELVSAIGVRSAGKNLKDLAGPPAPSLVIQKNLASSLKSEPVNILVDLTEPAAAMKNGITALENGVAAIIGTSGISSLQLKTLERISKKNKTPVFYIPNFSVGAVLGMKFAQLASEWMSDVEIIEAHHDQKLDAPSGTAIETARLISEARSSAPTTPKTKYLKVDHVRGGSLNQIPIHSIRLKGLLAQQTVLFGAAGETLEIRHTTIQRSVYMRGVELCIRKILKTSGLTLGLDRVLK